MGEGCVGQRVMDARAAALELSLLLLLPPSLPPLSPLPSQPASRQSRDGERVNETERLQSIADLVSQNERSSQTSVLSLSLSLSSAYL